MRGRESAIVEISRGCSRAPTKLTGRPVPGRATLPARSGRKDLGSASRIAKKTDRATKKLAGGDVSLGAATIGGGKQRENLPSELRRPEIPAGPRRPHHICSIAGGGGNGHTPVEPGAKPRPRTVISCWTRDSLNAGGRRFPRRITVLSALLLERSRPRRRD